MKSIRGRNRGMDVGEEASDLDLGAAPGRGRVTAGQVLGTRDSTPVIHSTGTYPEPTALQALC